MAMCAYNKIPDEDIIAEGEELKQKVAWWFRENPRRKICKIDWFYNRSIDVRRENYEARIDVEVAKLVGEDGR